MRCSPLILAAFSLIYLSAAATETPEPVGYFIETLVNEDIDAEEGVNPAYCLRNGERLEILEGMEAYAGDKVITERGGEIAIAFLDSSAVTVRENSSLTIEKYDYPAQRNPTHLALDSGRAFFSVTPRPADARFYVKTVGGKVEVKGTKFEVFHYATATGYETSIAVTKGAVNLQPNATNALLTEIIADQALTLTMTGGNIKGYDGSTPVTIAQKNLSKTDIKALEATALSDIEVSVNKKKQIKIKSINVNMDGTKTYVKLTELNGNATSVSTTVKAANGKTTLLSIKESKGKISKKELEGSLSIRLSYVEATGASKVSISDKPAKLSYKGTHEVRPDGTEITDATAKNGARVVILKKVLPDGTVVKQITRFPPNAVEGTQETTRTRRNGERTGLTETVSTNQLADGDFETISEVGSSSSPPLPTGPAPVVTPGNVVLVPDTVIVSP